MSLKTRKRRSRKSPELYSQTNNMTFEKSNHPHLGGKLGQLDNACHVEF